jgi:hypothetical protein
VTIGHGAPPRQTRSFPNAGDSTTSERRGVSSSTACRISALRTKTVTMVVTHGAALHRVPQTCHSGDRRRATLSGTG